MSPYLQQRVRSLQHALRSWLGGMQTEGSPIRGAIERTVEEGLFSQGDVHFAVEHLAASVMDRQLERWLERCVVDNTDGCRGQSVLCLHAGNLPLVGMQDVLAVLLSGADYAGKLSRKDPWLMLSFQEVVRQEDIALPIEMSVDLQRFKGRAFSKWMFAGSHEGLHRVSAELSRLQVLLPGATSLLRTAHFSVASIPDWADVYIPDLLESILRYEGKGCRSVAIVYTNIHLEQVGTGLREAAEVWFEREGRAGVPSPAVRYRKAYNDAVGIPSVILGTHLLQEGIASPDFPDIVYWQPSRLPQEPRLAYGDKLQEVYGPGATPLVEAQRPPIDWKPDGQDPLAWLLGTPNA